MGIKLTSLLLLSAAASYALGGMDGLSNIPTTQVLPHSSYQIFGQLGWHRISVSPGEAATSVFPWVTGIRIGLLDKAEFGVELGQNISLSGKMQFVQEQDWVPALSFGGRQLFHSQEAHFYSIPDSLQEPYQGEVFLAVSKTFMKRVRLHGGISVIPGLDSGRAQPFWGMEQGLFSNVSLLYDGFRRNKELHHNAGLGISIRKVLRISFGATEINRFFYQGSEFGFYTSDREDKGLTGYSAPGVWGMISVTGFMKESMKESTPERLLALEKRSESQIIRQDKSEKRMDRLEMQVKSLQGNRPDSVAIRESQAERMLSDLVKSMQNEAWDPRESRRLQDSLMNLGEVANRMLVRTLHRESSAMDYRFTAIRIMGTTRNPAFQEILFEELQRDSEELQREALLALVQIGTPEILANLKTLRAKSLPPLQAQIDAVLPKGSKPASSTLVPAVPTPAVPPLPAQ